MVMNVFFVWTPSVRASQLHRKGTNQIKDRAHQIPKGLDEV